MRRYSAGKPLQERIDERTDKSLGPTACWPWTAGHSKKMIPVIYHDGKMPPVRRVIWEMLHGPMPPGRAATTTCDTPLCVQPAHLHLVLFKSSVEERFWSHVDHSAGPDACWPWKDAASFRRGYGMFRIGWKKPIVYASRQAWQFANAVHVLQTDDVIMHTCDNPPCCNPRHLQLGTHMANHKDMLAKGRAGWQKKRAAKAVGSSRT